MELNTNFFLPGSLLMGLRSLNFLAVFHGGFLFFLFVFLAAIRTLVASTTSPSTAAFFARASSVRVLRPNPALVGPGARSCLDGREQRPEHVGVIIAALVLDHTHEPLQPQPAVNVLQTERRESEQCIMVAHCGT